MRRSTAFISLTALVVLAFATVGVSQDPQPEQWISGVKVRVTSERHAFSAWFIVLRVNREQYSKSNLEVIWRHYCEKYTNLKDKLDIRVYVESAPGKDLNDSWDAIFSRQGIGAAAAGGDNEFYTYRPDLETPDKTEDVQLKGRYPFLRNAYVGDPESDFVVAAQRGDIDKLNSFLDSGMSINAKGYKGQTALMVACESGLLDLVTLLLKKGADVNAKDDWGDTALVAAVCHADSNKPKDQRRVNTQLVKTLLDNGAKVNVPDSGWTPLRCAASHGSNETVTMLLANGANLEARGASGMAALAQAIYDQQPTTFELLLKAGADVNSKDMSGYTPLMMAVRRKDARIVRILLSKGADMNAVNTEGQTALSIAEGHPGYQEIAEILRTHGARK